MQTRRDGKSTCEKTKDVSLEKIDEKKSDEAVEGEDEAPADDVRVAESATGDVSA